jgi:hypothetical protein
MLMPRMDGVRNKSLSYFRPRNSETALSLRAKLGTDPISEICRYNPEITNDNPDSDRSSVARSVEGDWLAVATGEIFAGLGIDYGDDDQPF